MIAGGRAIEMNPIPGIVAHDTFDEVTLYRLNKSTYDLIHRVQKTGRPLFVTRDNKVITWIMPAPKGVDITPDLLQSSEIITKQVHVNRSSE